MVCVPPEFSLRNPEITDGSLEVVSPGGKFLNTAHFSIRLENRDRVARQRYKDRTVRFRPHADPIRVSSSAGRMVKVLTRIIQCATKARRTSGWKFHPSNRRFDSVATRTASAEAAGTMSPVRGD